MWGLFHAVFRGLNKRPGLFRDDDIDLNRFLAKGEACPFTFHTMVARL